eukprot:GEMP01048767.1.p1 GENE.GEMP01048767.1~~GEMP01048767.1.p1  ORF type:complete len:358 (+),score=50.60 GEMP01048767.1:29-1102(+)
MGSTNRKKRKIGGAELDYTNVKFRRKDGLLSVDPYPYVFETFVKQRWLGKSLLDVYTREFLGKDREYYINAINEELIMVNREGVSTDYILKDSDLISHVTVCTENPVLDERLQVIADTDDLLVISKPSSIPIHACGVYRYLTVVSLLRLEGRTHPLLTTHRLDRLTSGLVLLAKNVSAAQRITELFTSKKVSKTYLCRVAGDFRTCTADGLFAVTKDENGVVVKGYITCVDFKVGKQILEEHEGKGKAAETLFQFDSYDPLTNESVVRAYPHSGRTHQIRVHLQHLGFPIANDPNYGVKEQSAIGSSNDLEERRDEAPTDHCTSIYLHAWRYKSDDWEYEAAQPQWAIIEHAKEKPT